MWDLLHGGEVVATYVVNSSNKPPHTDGIERSGGKQGVVELSQGLCPERKVGYLLAGG